MHDVRILCQGSPFGHDGLCGMFCPLVVRILHHVFPHVPCAVYRVSNTLSPSNTGPLVPSISGHLRLLGQRVGGGGGYGSASCLTVGARTPCPPTYCRGHCHAMLVAGGEERIVAPVCRDAPGFHSAVVTAQGRGGPPRGCAPKAARAPAQAGRGAAGAEDAAPAAGPVGECAAARVLGTDQSAHARPVRVRLPEDAFAPDAWWWCAVSSTSAAYARVLLLLFGHLLSVERPRGGGVWRCAIFRTFSQFAAIFPQLLFVCPPCVPVGALCVPCAEVLLFEASGGSLTAPQFSRNFSTISPQFVAIGFHAS